MNSTIPTDVFDNFKYSGLGQIRFDNEDSLDVRFEISLLNNGIIIGSIKFITFDFRTGNHIQNNDSFVLEGVEERHSSTVVATGCKAIKYSSSTDFTNSSVHESATFTAFELNMKYKNSDTIETDKLILEFGIMNVHNVLHGASVNTNLGILELSNYVNIKERQDLMSIYHTPLITSNISLSTDSNTDRKSLDKLVDEGIKIVDDFLKITSFFQTTWHEWVFVIANAVSYDKTNKLLRPLSIRMITPKSKPPYFRMISIPFLLEPMSMKRGKNTPI